MRVKENIKFFFSYSDNKSEKCGECMIACKKINGQNVYINAELIEFIESTPDTIITTITGKKIIVQDTVDEIINRIIAYKKKIFEGATIKLQGNADEENHS